MSSALADALGRREVRASDRRAVSKAGSPASKAGSPAVDPRTRLLLQGSIVPTLLRFAWPNMLVMLAQASTGLIETWWVSHLGTDALAGMALVFPAFMMMQMLSAGAMGGGISSAIARALGGGRRADADALVLHAIVVNLLLGLTFSVLVLAFGRSLYGALGGEGESLEAALLYSNVVFAGNGLVWLLNALASAIRGTGNMLVPSLAVCVGVVLLVPLSPLLIFGIGPIPALGIAGAGMPSSSALPSRRQCWPGTSRSAAAWSECGWRGCVRACSATSWGWALSARSAHCRPH
jgi:Na+-driven multidrug efflux pump